MNDNDEIFLSYVKEIKIMSGKISVSESRTGKQYYIKVAANQKVIQIHRVKNGINFEANYKAMAVLSANAYVLYMYLLMHENHRVWALSSKDVYAKTALTEKTYTKAVAELIEKTTIFRAFCKTPLLPFNEFTI